MITIFSVKERIVLGSILPAQGNITTLKIIRKLREDLSFSEEDHKVLRITFDKENDRIQWDSKIGETYVKEIEVGEKAMDVIREALTSLNNKNQLNDSLVEIYERFVENKS